MVALALLGASLLPAEVARRAGLAHARAASLKLALAVGGISVGCGYLIALMLSRTQ